jgi:hypothetical protein
LAAALAWPMMWTRSTDLIGCNGWGGYLNCNQIGDQLITGSQHRFFLVQQPRVLYSKKTIASILQLQHHFSNHFALPNLLYRLLGAFKRMHGIDDIVELDPGG